MRALRCRCRCAHPLTWRVKREGRKTWTLATLQSDLCLLWFKFFEKSYCCMLISSDLYSLCTCRESLRKILISDVRCFESKQRQQVWSEKLILLLFSSYAREFQAKLKELQDSKVAAAAVLSSVTSNKKQTSKRKDHNGNSQVSGVRKSCRVRTSFKQRWFQKQNGLRRSPNPCLPILTSNSPTPIISITPTSAKKPSPVRKQDSPIKMDSNGALNLTRYWLRLRPPSPQRLNLVFFVPPAIVRLHQTAASSHPEIN